MKLVQRISKALEEQDISIDNIAEAGQAIHLAAALITLSVIVKYIDEKERYMN